MTVSVITPTVPGREHMLNRCRRIVSDQDYPEIEHIIVPTRGSIGMKLNAGIEMASGDIIVRFDDDDLYASDYISRCVDKLKSGTGMTGVCKFHLYNPNTGQLWLYDYNGSLPYIAGSGSAFWRKEWAKNRYPDSSMGEDGRFCMGMSCDVEAIDYVHGMVAVLHGRNTASHLNTHTYKKITSPGEREVILNGLVKNYITP